MRIVCPSCATSYVIDPISLGSQTHKVRCTRCKTVWVADWKAHVDITGIIAELIAKTEVRNGRMPALVRCQSALPPIHPSSFNGNNHNFVNHSRASSRRHSGILLTGAALIAGIVFTFLDNRTNYASVPAEIEVALRGAFGGSDKFGIRRKSDRLLPAEDTKASRQVIRVSMAMRVGNHEVMRARPLVRIAGNLSLNVSNLSADIPAHNMKQPLMESAFSSAASETPASELDADVVFVMRDMTPLLSRLNITPTITNEDAIKRLHEIYDLSENSGRHLPVAKNVADFKLTYAAETRKSGPNANSETRSVPANVTLLPKTTRQITASNAWNERVITVKKGDDISSVLHALDTTVDEITSIIAVLRSHGHDGRIKDGQKLHVLLAPADAGTRLQPVRVIIANGTSAEAAVALSDMGKYVSVEVHNIYINAAENGSDDSDGNDISSISLYQSVIKTAQRNQISDSIINDLFRIYSNDFDFQRKARQGDAFELLFGSEEETSGKDDQNTVLYSALTVGGKTKKYYRYQSPDEKLVGYYDEAGKSAKKLLVRNPVISGIVRSGFGPRRDPILGYTRMHTGVDIAVPTGTPIRASGNGIVEMIGWESGYGKYIRIRHTNRYETAYGHMTAYARDIKAGTRVRQGQVIGFVGSTGFSTGPHLHYEILVDGRFVDPIHVELPRERVLVGPMLTSFEREREEIDSINNGIASGPSLVASTQPLPR